VTFEGTGGIIIPIGTQLRGPDNFDFETTEGVQISTTGAVDCTVRALKPGAVGNLLAGDHLGLDVIVPGVEFCTVTYDMTDGTDEEIDDDLRLRVLERIQHPPMGGDKEDYINWALRVPGVTRAWSFPLEMGIGTVTVRFMMDIFRASNDGFPTETDVNAVIAYLDTVRPVAIKDYFVVAPIKQSITCVIGNLEPDTSDVRAGIEASVRDMLLRKASPGQTIFAAWKSEAIMSAPQVVSFNLVVNDDDVMDSPGHMALLGDLEYV
jgi:uncharacterized phage protein gp47/JayE